MSIRARIILAALAAIALVNVASVIYFVDLERRAAVARLHETIDADRRLLRVVTAGPLYDGNVAQLNAILNSIAANPDILEIELKETRGDIALARRQPAAAERGERMQRVIPVLRGRDELGKVRVTYTTANIEQHLAESRNAIMLFSLLLMAILSLAIYALAAGLTRPIERLTRAAREIAAGDLEREIDARGAQELAILGRSFIRMRDAVREKMADLAHKNRQLHEQVYERLRAESALRESDERLRQAVRVASIGIFDHDQVADTIYWSPEQRQIYGVGPDAAVTLQGFLEQVFPGDLERIGAAVKQAHDPSGDGLFDVEHRIVRADGSIRWVATRSQTFFEGEGRSRRPVRTIGAVLDVTERRNAEEMRALLAAVVETTSDAIIVTRPQMDIVSWNSGAERMFGWAAAEVVGRSHSLIVPPELRHEPQRNTGLLEAGEAPPTFETVRLTKDGRRLHVQVNLSGIYDEEGRLKLVAGIFRDVTERRLLEAERARLAAIVENSSDAIISRALDGEVRTWNAAAERMFGYQAAEVIGKDIGFIIPPDRRDEVAEKRARLAQGEAGSSYDTVRLARDGRRIDVSATQSPIRNEKGELTGVSLTFRDIAERKAAEQALRASEAKISEAYATLNDAIESAPAAIAIYDAADRLIACNSRFKAFFDFDPPFVRPGIEFTALVRRFAESGQVARPRRTGEDWLTERRRAHRDAAGPIELELTDGRWLQITETRTVGGGVVTVYSDITALKEREAELRSLNEELESKVVERTAALAAANKELEAFAYSVSHDLRAPLRAIDGFSRVLIEDYGANLDAEARGYLDRVRNAVQRMGELIDDMLQLSRVARVEMRPVTVDLSRLAAEIAAQLKAAAPERNVELRIGSGIRARGDARLIEIVLTNLLQNAWKYTGKTADARIEFAASVENGETVYRVSDNGVGFDMQYAGKLFGAFQRLHSERDFPGTGVGLATVARIVHRHGGRVWALGEPRKGASFFFTLPS